MDVKDKRDRIVSELKMVAALTPGETISTSTMSIIRHDSWSTSFWRKYSRENRHKTISYVRDLLTEAIDNFKINRDDELLNNIEQALIGVSELKETYKGDLTTVDEIESIISQIKKEIINKDLVVQPEDDFIIIETEEALENYVEEIIQSELEKADSEEKNLIDQMVNDNTVATSSLHSSGEFSASERDQKIHSNKDHESKGSANITSYFEDLVSSPNRRTCQEAIETTVCCCCPGNHPEGSTLVCNGSSFHVNISTDNPYNELLSKSITVIEVVSCLLNIQPQADDYYYYDGESCAYPGEEYKPEEIIADSDLAESIKKIQSCSSKAKLDIEEQRHSGQYCQDQPSISFTPTNLYSGVDSKKEILVGNETSPLTNFAEAFRKWVDLINTSESSSEELIIEEVSI